MGRPWWYDDYWDRGPQRQRRRLRIPGRRSMWIWAAILVLSLLLTIINGSFHLSIGAWILGFVYYLCRVLSFVILIRVLLTWFAVSRDNILVIILDEIAEPMLRPLRRIIPLIGVFDITPIIVILFLYIIPWIISVILF